MPILRLRVKAGLLRLFSIVLLSALCALCDDENQVNMMFSLSFPPNGLPCLLHGSHFVLCAAKAVFFSVGHGQLQTVKSHVPIPPLPHSRDLRFVAVDFPSTYRKTKRINRNCFQNFLDYIFRL